MNDQQNALDKLKQRMKHSLERARDAGAHTWTTLKDQHALERVRNVSAQTWSALKDRHALERVRDASAQTWTTLKDRHALERVRDVSAQTWTTLKQRPWMGTGLAILGGLALAAVIDAAELAVAMSAGILAYQALANHPATAAPVADAAHA